MLFRFDVSELQLFLAHRLYYIIYLNELYTIMIPKILHFFCILFHPNWTWSGQVTHFSWGNTENSRSDDTQTFPDHLMGEGFMCHCKSQISYHFWLRTQEAMTHEHFPIVWWGKVSCVIVNLRSVTISGNKIKILE